MSSVNVIISKSVSSLAPTPNSDSSNKTDEVQKVQAITPVGDLNGSKKENESVANKATILTEQERLELRAKKFGAQLDSAKLENRAKRFGALNTSNSEVDNEKLKKRAERFGADSTTPTTNDTDTDALKKRAQRFGVSENSTNGLSLTDEKLSKRKERFGATNDDDAKKKQRAERFEKK